MASPCNNFSRLITVKCRRFLTWIRVYVVDLLIIWSVLAQIEAPRMTFNDKAPDNFVKELASDYADYLLVDASEEHFKLTQVMHSLSTNLEEFSSLLESINLDTTLCVDSLLPQISTHYEKVQETFKQIDTMERAVAVVGKSVTAMEEEMNNAEGALGAESFHRLKSVFRPFIKQSNTRQNSKSSLPVVQQNKVEIFEIDDLWKAPQEPNKTG